MHPHRSRRALGFLALALAVLPLASCGGGGSDVGIVGRLTGDPDDEVGDDLQGLVSKALRRDEADAPIDD